MSIGAFKLNSLSKLLISEGGGEEYFILYSTNQLERYWSFDVDSDGNIFTSDQFQYMKIQPSGTVAWQKVLTGDFDYDPSEIFATTTGNMVGFPQYDSVNNRIATGPLILSGSDGSEVAKYPSYINGNEGSRFASATKGYVDSSNNMYISRNDPIDYANVSVVWKYNSSGSVQWHRTLWNESRQLLDMHVDSSGNLYGCASTSYIHKINSSGDSVWTKSTLNNNYTSCIKSDTAGNVYVSGSRLMKLNSSGDFQWSRSFSAGSPNSSQAFDLDTDGNVYVITGPVSSYFNLYKLNSSGTLQWSRRIYIGNHNYPRIKIKNGSIYITGVGTVSGANDGSYIMKLPLDGSKTGTYGNFQYTTGSLTVTTQSESMNDVSPQTSKSLYRVSQSRSITYANTSYTFSKTTVT